MKKILILVTTLLIFIMPLSGCGRVHVDISGATNIHELKGATIAAQTATFHVDALNQIKDEINVEVYDSFNTLYTALLSGSIDGYIAEWPTAYSKCEKDKAIKYLDFVNNDTGFTASDSDTGIAVGLKKGDPRTPQINAIVHKVSVDTRQELMKQVIRMSASPSVSLDEEPALKSKNTEKKNGVLKVAMECAYDPFNWTQNSDVNGAVPIKDNDGSYANGYDVQFAKYIADELGMELEVHKYEWDSLISSVQSGIIDCIMAGMSPTAEREKLLSFTDCYYTSNLVIIYKNDEEYESEPFFTSVGSIITTHWKGLMKGIGNTLLIALIGTVAGLLIGILTGYIRTIPYSKNKFLRGLHKVVNWLIAVYVEVFRGTPMMVQAMVIYWGYAFMFNIKLPTLPAGIFIVSINTGAYITEIIRGGIISIDKGQFEGAYSVGMTHWQAMIHVIIPQMFRNILPSVSNEFVINIKDTSVLNVINVQELFFIAKDITSLKPALFPTYFILSVIYLAMTFTITRILRLIEKKLEGKGNYTICGSQSDPSAEIKVKGDTENV